MSTDEEFIGPTGMSKLTIQEAKKRLQPHLDNDDDEAYHVEFDDILEEKLAELDPKFMAAMTKLYDKSEMARWCA